MNGQGHIQLEKLAMPKPKHEVNKEVQQKIGQIIELEYEKADLIDIKDQLEIINKKTTNDWAIATLKNRELDQTILDMQEKFDVDIKKLKDNFKKREMKLLMEKDKISANFTRYQEDLKKELKVREELMSRYANYSESLKKQLVISKNVIKNPAIMTNAMRKYNFNELQIYKYDQNTSNDKYVCNEVPLKTTKNADSVVEKLFDNHLVKGSYQRLVFYSNDYRLSFKNSSIPRKIASRGLITSKISSTNKDFDKYQKRPSTSLEGSQQNPITQ